MEQKITQHRLQLDRESDAYKRMESAGFTMNELVQINQAWARFGRIYFVMPFRCVCGMDEELGSYYDMPEGWENQICVIDACRRIEQLGGVSIEHLRDDGYNEASIARIRIPYAGFEEKDEAARTISSPGYLKPYQPPKENAHVTSR